MDPTTSTKGILRPNDALRHIDLRRYPAGAEVSRYVERHWSVHWDLTEPYDVELIPHPSMNLTIGPEAIGFVHGVGTRKSVHHLTGKSFVFGVKFRPGGLAAYTGANAAELTDRSVPMHEVFGAEARAIAVEVASATSDAERVSIVERRFAAHLPEPDPSYDDVLRAITLMLHDRTVTRADDAAERLGLNLRTLQRLFRRYVGVGPKWVIRRYRMHDAAERLASGDADAASLAVELGWFDQAHFSRDFSQLIGMPPVEYALACARAEDREPIIVR